MDTRVNLKAGKARDLYLEDKGREEALEIFYSAWKNSGGAKALEGEEIEVTKALGRITAKAVIARLSSPHYHGSAMDGIAIKANRTFGASAQAPKVLVHGEDFVWVDTGDPLPAGYDAVIMVEQVHVLSETELEITAPAAPWQHVRAIGEDVVAGEIILPANHRIGASDLGAMLSAGVTRVMVRRKPRVAILPTGDEIVSPEVIKPEPGQILESNGVMLGAQAETRGAEVRVFPAVPDVFVEMKERVIEVLEWADLVIINAGSSAGRDDYAARVVAELGQVLVHGVAIRPGNPVVLGLVGDRPVLGIPGYPVSAAVTFDLFAGYAIDILLGQKKEGLLLEALMAKKVYSSSGREEFLRVQVGRVGDNYVAWPLARGAGVIMSLVKADGLVSISSHSEGLNEKESVRVSLLRDTSFSRSLVVAGGDDPLLSIWNDRLKTLAEPIKLVASNVGIYGGLKAIRDGLAHAALLSHLDAKTGEYNTGAIQAILGDKEVVRVLLTKRVQGLMVAPGNPKGIKGIRDLFKGVFVNRQQGSGTRILLDYLLEREGLDKESIIGYEREELSHMAVAAGVAGGTADVGLGIKTAADTLGLDFVPLWSEPLELVIPIEFSKVDVVTEALSVFPGGTDRDA